MPRYGRAALVLILSLAYLASVFQIFSRNFWEAGIGDWVDPYFINFLLEHWYRGHLSLPMYFPAPHTLGYSHTLILFAPFYAAVRPFFHPFVAHNLTLLLVIETGIGCLYVLLRKFANLSAIESVVLCAFFFTSQNVISGAMASWTQRASVFLIPPILLLTLISVGRPLLAALSGLLAALLLLQDYPTALFTAFMFVLVCAPFARRIRATTWSLAYCAGVLVGVAIFLWIYVPAYREHSAYPPEQVLSVLSSYRHPYYTWRPFILVALVAALTLRRYAAWFVLVSAIVLLIPIRFDSFSLWTNLFEHLPGFAPIRHPMRVIYIYELAVILVTAALMIRASPKIRAAIVMIAVVLMATDWNRATFFYGRPIAMYARWVSAPIAIDPRCKSFFFEVPEPPTHISATQSISAMFIALNHGPPTLNGYSAWAPPGWTLANDAAVDRWIRRYGLTGVCVFDLERRTMRPR